MVEVEFTVEVSSETLEEALLHVGARAGWRHRRVADSDTCVVVDALRPVVGASCARRTILVIDPAPFAARRAMTALAAGTVTAVITADRPRDLVAAGNSVTAGWGSVPVAVLELAAQMPDLSERQVAVISAVLAGQSNREIARSLYLSDASVKRELASLFRSLGADGRLALAAYGASLGLQPRRLAP